MDGSTSCLLRCMAKETVSSVWKMFIFESTSTLYIFQFIFVVHFLLSLLMFLNRLLLSKPNCFLHGQCQLVDQHIVRLVWGKINAVETNDIENENKWLA